MIKKTTRGFGLIELMIGIAIIGMVLAASFDLSRRAITVRANTTESVQASLLLDEGAEAMRLIRDSGWATTTALSLNTDYTLTWDGVMWKADPITSGAFSLIDGVFDRRFQLGSISRDGNHRIVASGGTVDPDGKMVTVSLAWRAPYGATTTRQSSFYLFNIF